MAFHGLPGRSRGKKQKEKPPGYLGENDPFNFAIYTYQPQKQGVKPSEKGYRTEIPRATMTENAPEIENIKPPQRIRIFLRFSAFSSEDTMKKKIRPTDKRLRSGRALLYCF